jgi:hypothetical protein
MKKLLFVLAFAFIGQQSFSQMYMIHIGSYSISPTGCDLNNEYTLTKVDPTGNATHTCICQYISPNPAYTNCSSGISSIVQLNQEFNSLISQGYKLVYGPTNPQFSSHTISTGTTWIFAIP